MKFAKIAFVFLIISIKSIAQTTSTNTTTYTGTSPNYAVISSGAILVSGDSTMPTNTNTLPTQKAVNNFVNNNKGIINAYNRGGVISSKLKMFADTFTLTTAPQILDISSAGFTNVYSVSISGINNTSTIANMPLLTVKSYSTTAVTINIEESNSSLISLLGAIAVGLAAPTNFTGVKAFIQVIGN